LLPSRIQGCAPGGSNKGCAFGGFVNSLGNSYNFAGWEIL